MKNMSVVKEIKITDKNYPPSLKKIKGAPKQFYYKGKWDMKLFKNCLAVVGSRRMTTHGKQAVKMLVCDCARAGITIVSGFMYGVDAAAHKATIDAGGRTIAVMPCGIDMVHPEHQVELYKGILDNGGLIISEYPKNTPPYLGNYPARNRIVAGLSQAVLVIEAALASGSLITADLAKKFKRHLLAVPGPISSIVSMGTLQLIRDGALIAGDAQDVLRLYSLTQAKINSRVSCKDNYQQQVIDCLKREPMRPDDLAYALKIDVAKVTALLLMMQLKGLVDDCYGRFSLNLDEVK
jgi:DNA processing protein